MKRLYLIIASLAALLLSQAAFAQERPAVKSDEAILNDIRQARYVANKPNVQSLGILHYSDIHGDDIAAKDIDGYITRFSPYIDAVLNTGDAALYFAEGTGKYPNGARWWSSTDLAGKSLFVLGNHDGASPDASKGHREGSADWDFQGKNWDFDTYFAPYIDRLGYVMPDGYDKPSSPYYKSCFWHKDFPEAKVRIIGLDCIHFNDTFRYLSGEQEEWFSRKLDETLDPGNAAFGYSVIVASHFPLDDFIGNNEVYDEKSHKFLYNVSPEGGRLMDRRTGDVSNFHYNGIRAYIANKRFSMRAKTAVKEADYGYVSAEANPLGDVLQAWVDKGGKFVIWLCGHCHNDMLFYPAKYPGLLCLAVDQAGNLRGNGNSDRSEDLTTHSCANYYSVDTQNGLFKIVRLGLSRDRFMVEKNVLCYDYINKSVIFE